MGCIVIYRHIPPLPLNSVSKHTSSIFVAERNSECLDMWTGCSCLGLRLGRQTEHEAAESLTDMHTTEDQPTEGSIGQTAASKHIGMCLIIGRFGTSLNNMCTN